MRYTKYEKARIIGARALQLSLGAPPLLDFPQDVVDPVDMAVAEFEAGLTPITVHRRIS